MAEATTCCVCEGIIPSTITCQRCQRPACQICTDPNFICVGCTYTARRGVNRGKRVTGPLDPLPDAPCDLCTKSVPANELTYCAGDGCLKRMCHDCLCNDAVRCACQEAVV